MVNVVARIKAKGKQFEIMVDCDRALNLRKSRTASPGAMRDVLAVDFVFTHYQKGIKASSSELTEAFGTEDVYEIASKIVSEGEIQLPQEFRDKDRELKLKQIVDFLARNCVDPRTHAPYTADRIASAIKQAGARIDEHKSADDQALEIIHDLMKIMPIKIETKRIKLVIPAEYTGRIFGILASLKKEKEEWLADGSLECIIDLPAGMQLEFYDKLNAITHGNSITEELQEA
ncbi:MAG: ribosome assembly factor SBDS [Candidatus Methylomirabilota bacterium]